MGDDGCGVGDRGEAVAVRVGIFDDEAECFGSGGFAGGVM